MVVGRSFLVGVASALIGMACGGRSVSPSDPEDGDDSPGTVADGGTPGPSEDVVPPFPESTDCPVGYVRDTGGCAWSACSAGDYQCHRLCPKGWECESTPCVWHRDCANDYCWTEYFACGIDSQR